MKWIKQLFCKHANLEEYRRYLGLGYVFQCPKCGAYFLYRKDFDGTLKISKRIYDDYIKFHSIEENL